MANQRALYRSLEALHRTGMGWPEALQAAAPGGMPRALAALQQGKPLSEALHDDVDALDVALIRAGESSGSLEATFARLADRHDAEAKRRKALRSAIAYPVFLAHIGAVLLALPDLIQGNVGSALTWAAMILVPCWLWISVGMRTTSKARDGDPVAPGPVHALNRSAVEDADSRALLALGDCLDAAVPLPETLRLAARAGAGGRVAADLAQAAIGVHDGKAISSFYEHTPEDVRRALTLSETTGDLSDTAREYADHLAFSATQRRNKFKALLPPVMILTIGALIAYKVISFYANAFRMPNL